MVARLDGPWFGSLDASYPGGRCTDIERQLGCGDELWGLGHRSEEEWCKGSHVESL
jgi:hypothetical protein